jgi:hypothetical protein
MKENFVTYEQALKLKSMGFDEPCLAKFNHKKKLEISYCLEKTCGYDMHKNSLTLKGSYGNGVIACSAPLKQQVFKFLYICSKGEINITYKASDCEDTINNKIDNGIKKLRNII